MAKFDRGGYSQGMTTEPASAVGGMELLARLLNSHPETAFDYLEFRSLLGGEAAAYAAQRASEEEILKIRACLADVEKAHQLDDPTQEVQADSLFHLAIYEAAHNEVITHIMRVVFEMLRYDVFYDRSVLYQRRGVRDSFLRQHQALSAAIAARDPDAARLAAKEHLASAAEALREYQLADRRREVSSRRAEGAGLTQAKGR